MLRAHFMLAATAALVLFAGQAQAAPCRDSAGKFTACPSAPAPSGQRCRTPNGAFAKCSAPGAKPVSASATTKTTTAKAKPAKAKTTTVASASKSTTKAK